MIDIFVNGQQIIPPQITKVADLTSLDNNKWYPYRIYSDPTAQGITRLRKVSIEAKLDVSGSPSYGTHDKSKGAFTTMTVLATENSWGVRPYGFGYLLDMTNNFVADKKKCIALKLSTAQLGFIFYLRGGLKYTFNFGNDLLSQLYPAGLNQNGENFNPVDQEPANDANLIDLKSKLGG